MQYVIVSRQAAAVAFIRAQDARFAEAPVITQNATADDVRGKTVAGNLPLQLAALAKQVVAVEFAGAPPRGVEYSVEDMKNAAAYLACYTVKQVALGCYTVPGVPASVVE